MVRLWLWQTIYFGLCAACISVIAQAAEPKHQIDSEQNLPLTATAANQSPTFKIYVFPFFLARPVYISGFSGSASILSERQGFSEALVSVDDTLDGSACSAGREVYENYSQLRSRYPTLRNLAKLILKVPVGVSSSTIPISVAFPQYVQTNGCVVVTLDGATLRTGGTFIMSSNLIVHFVKRGLSDAKVSTLSLDDEFCFGTTSGCQIHIEHPSSQKAFIRAVVIKKPAELLTMYGNVSVSTFGWSSAKSQDILWDVTNNYYVVRKCSLSDGVYGPIDKALSPLESTILLSTHEQQQGQGAVQFPINKTFSHVVLMPGDCLVHEVQTSDTTAEVGGVDAESQVLALIKELQ